MPGNPPENMPRITPNAFYDDLGAALDWRGKVFGFETRMSLSGPEGGIVHAEGARRFLGFLQESSRPG